MYPLSVVYLIGQLLGRFGANNVKGLLLVSFFFFFCKGGGLSWRPELSSAALQIGYNPSTELPLAGLCYLIISAINHDAF